MQRTVIVQAWLVFVMACFASMVVAAPAKKAEDAVSIVGTWSSGSQQVSTGRIGNNQFTAPTSGGISYSFTEDGFFEVAKFQYNSNCKLIDPDDSAEHPNCFTAQLIWQHGTYVSNESSITMNPYKGDGAVQTLNPCQSKDKQLQMSVYADNWSTYIESQPAFIGTGDETQSAYSMQLYAFDGSPLSKMYLTYNPPNMLPKTQIFKYVVGASS